MLDAILQRLPPEQVERAALTTSGLMIEPHPGFARVRIAQDSRWKMDPDDASTALLNADGLRVWAALLNAAADVVEAVAAKEEAAEAAARRVKTVQEAADTPPLA